MNESKLRLSSDSVTCIKATIAELWEEWQLSRASPAEEWFAFGCLAGGNGWYGGSDSESERRKRLVRFFALLRLVAARMREDGHFRQQNPHGDNWQEKWDRDKSVITELEQVRRRYGPVGDIPSETQLREWCQSRFPTVPSGEKWDLQVGLMMYTALLLVGMCPAGVVGQMAGWDSESPIFVLFGIAFVAPAIVIVVRNASWQRRYDQWKADRARHWVGVEDWN